MTTAPSERAAAAAPRSSESARGSMPAIIATVVITIGRKRSKAAWIIAARVAFCVNRKRLAKSTSRMPFLLTSPTSSTQQMNEKRFNVWWVRAERSQRADDRDRNAEHHHERRAIAVVERNHQ